MKLVSKSILAFYQLYPASSALSMRDYRDRALNKGQSALCKAGSLKFFIRFFNRNRSPQKCLIASPMFLLNVPSYLKIISVISEKYLLSISTTAALTHKMITAIVV